MFLTIFLFSSVWLYRMLPKFIVTNSKRGWIILMDDIRIQTFRVTLHIFNGYTYVTWRAGYYDWLHFYWYIIHFWNIQRRTESTIIHKIQYVLEFYCLPRSVYGRVPSYSCKSPRALTWRLIVGSNFRMYTASSICSFLLLDSSLMMLMLLVMSVRVSRSPWWCVSLCVISPPCCKCIVILRLSVVVVFPM